MSPLVRRLLAISRKFSLKFDIVKTSALVCVETSSAELLLNRILCTRVSSRWISVNVLIFDTTQNRLGMS